MESFSTTWTKEELKAYLFLYCSHADFEESKAEMEYIKSKLQDLNLATIHAEFDADNDYQSIQKIRLAMKRLQLSASSIELLEKEMKELFLADGKFDSLEKSLYLGIKRILEN
jgi:uncharacterized protein YfkK (UPF0435 family)